jgi:hypothetical protein
MVRQLGLRSYCWRYGAGVGVGVDVKGWVVVKHRPHLPESAALHVSQSLGLGLRRWYGR